MREIVFDDLFSKIIRKGQFLNYGPAPVLNVRPKVLKYP